MRIRKLEFALIALTLAFACFTGGFFAGRKGTVNVVTLAPQSNEPISVLAQLPAGAGETEALPPAAQPDQTTAQAMSSSETTETAVTQNEQTQPGAPKGGDGKININTASQGELTDLPGIGDTLAGRIIDYRQKHGSFLQVEDIRSVSGIGEKRYDAIKELITV